MSQTGIVSNIFSEKKPPINREDGMRMSGQELLLQFKNSTNNMFINPNTSQ